MRFLFCLARRSDGAQEHEAFESTEPDHLLSGTCFVFLWNTVT